MTQLDTAQTIINTLRAGMSTGHTETDDYFVREWFTGDPLIMQSFAPPACAVIPQLPGANESEFVGVDNVTETFSVQFFQLARRKDGEEAETAAGLTRLIAMMEKARQLLRADPTFGAIFVMSAMTNIDPMMSLAPGGVYRVAKFTLTMKRPVLWGQ